eukprot:TRINITY_DN15131_c0_g1_i1.p1 TRINITY_DN15131_c0_g1~~TRINITY_DN15131_c0_g1_i1.p1  ORF type:complete len:647 (+),score=232.98 TRINITY_DN15131_c0_g1_i1:123-2063(+)
MAKSTRKSLQLKQICIGMLVLASVASGQQQWSSPVSGIFGDSSGWLGGLIPNLLSTATSTISAVGSPFTVVVNAATSLASPLTLGGVGSNPTLLIDGVLMNVPALNFVSGTIQLVNGGALNVAGGLVVNNAASNVVINAATGTIGTLASPISVLAGKLVVTGSTVLQNSIQVASNGLLVLNGAHAMSTCSFSGSGIVQVEGSLTIQEGAGECSFDQFHMKGGRIVGENSDGSASQKVRINKMKIVDDLPMEIDGITVNVGNVTMKAGSIKTTGNGKLAVLGSLFAPVVGVATLSGNIYTSGGLFVQTGSLFMNQAVITSPVVVSPNSYLYMHDTVFASGSIDNQGNIQVSGNVSLSPDAGAQIDINGGSMNFTAGLRVDSGKVNFNDVTAEGQVTVGEKGLLMLNSVSWANPIVYNSGIVYVSDILSLTGPTQIYGGGIYSYFRNKGRVDVDSELVLDGEMKLEGIFNVSSKGRFNLNGRHALSGNLVVGGDLEVTGALHVGENSMKIEGDLHIQEEGAFEITSKANAHVRGFYLSSGSTYAVNLMQPQQTPVLNVGNVAYLNGNVVFSVGPTYPFELGYQQVFMNYFRKSGNFTHAETSPHNPDYEHRVVYGEKSASFQVAEASSGVRKVVGILGIVLFLGFMWA